MASKQVDVRPTPYELIGGTPGVTALVDRFYDLMEQDPAYAELRAMHMADLGETRQSLTGFFSGWLGGPREWFTGGKCVMSMHARLPIDALRRDQWIAAMQRAADATIADAALRAQLMDALTRMSGAMARKSQA